MGPSTGGNRGGCSTVQLGLGFPPLPRGCGLPCSCMHTHLVRIYLQPLSSSRQLPSSPAGGHGAPSSRARGPSKKSAASALPFSPGVRGHGRRREEPVPATRELTSLGTISSAGPRAAETGRGLGMTWKKGKGDPELPPARGMGPSQHCWLHDRGPRAQGRASSLPVFLRAPVASRALRDPPHSSPWGWEGKGGWGRAGD